MNILSIIVWLVMLASPLPLVSMEWKYEPNLSFSQSPTVEHKDNKREVEAWIKNLIKPINAGRYYQNNQSKAKSNCTLVAETCAAVLTGQIAPFTVDTSQVGVDVVLRLNEENHPVYQEVHRKEQTQFLPFHELKETLDLESKSKSMDLTYEAQPIMAKYIPSYLTSKDGSVPLITDIKNLAGTAESKGEDKTLAGLIYYHYEDISAGHLANFFRDTYGNVFFVDAQSEEVTETPPAKILDYTLLNEVFFFPIPPTSGYYIKNEKEMHRIIKEEDSPKLDRTNNYPLKSNKIASFEEYLRHEEIEKTRKRSRAPISHPILPKQKKQNKKNGITQHCEMEGCEKTTKSSSQMRSHLEYEHKICQRCPESFKNLNDLQEHNRIEHKRKIEYELTCLYCAMKYFSSSPAVTRDLLDNHTSTNHLEEIRATLKRTNNTAWFL